MDNPLYNINIERAILSTFIFEPERFDEVAFKLKSEDFYLPFHQKVYDTFLTLRKKDLPIDEEFLRIYLEKEGAFDEIKMLEILASSPISNLESYIDELIKKSKKRKLKTLSLEINKMIYEEDRSPDEMIEISDEPPFFMLDTNRYGKPKISDKFMDLKESFNKLIWFYFDPLIGFYGGDCDG